MTAAPEISSKQLIKILDFQNFLVETWKSDKQRPAIYGNASTMDWSGHLWEGLR